MKKFKELSKKQKLFMLPIFAILLIGSVFAVGYLVNTLTLNVGVKEAFEVEYAILGDGEHNYDGQSCEDIETVWFPSGVIDTSVTDTMLPGQSRYICVKIENEAGVLPYTISANVVGVDELDTPLCVSAFGQYEVSGLTVASDGITDGVTISGFDITVPANAEPVTGCLATVDVLRG